MLVDRSIHPHQMGAQGWKAGLSDAGDLQSVTRARKCLAGCAVSPRARNSKLIRDKQHLRTSGGLANLRCRIQTSSRKGQECILNCWTVDVMKDAPAAVDWSSQEAPALLFVHLHVSDHCVCRASSERASQAEALRSGGSFESCGTELLSV